MIKLKKLFKFIYEHVDETILRYRSSRIANKFRAEMDSMHKDYTKGELSRYMHIDTVTTFENMYNFKKSFDTIHLVAFSGIVKTNDDFKMSIMIVR